LLLEVIVDVFRVWQKIARSEDWLALVIGLALALLAGIGVLFDIPWPVFGWLK